MEFDDHDDQEEEEEEGEEEEEEEEEDIMEDISIPITMAPVHLSQIVDPDGGITSNSRKNSGAAVIRYRECQKNHAAGIGRHAVDGCCEFIAAGEEDTLDALKCAACNCHRNFHRKETAATTVSDQHQSINNYQFYHGHHQFSSFPNYYRSYPHPSGYLNNLNTSQPRPLALPGVTSGGGGGCQSRDEGEDASIPSSSNGGGGGSGSKSKSKRKKRYRTKFTAVQKEKMLELSERIGWRIQKHDESAVEQFSLDTGVSRHVLKVWMHNNKHTLL